MLGALRSVLGELSSDRLSNFLKFSYFEEKKKKKHFHFLLISEKMSLGSETAVGTLRIKKRFQMQEAVPLSEEICFEGEERNRHLCAKYRTRHSVNIRSWDRHTSPKWCLAVSTLQKRKLSPTASSPAEIEPQVQSLSGHAPPGL